MALIDQFIEIGVGISEIKQSRLQQASDAKRKALEPAFENLAPDNYDVVDGDTIRLRDTGKLLRFGSGQNGRSIDTFESDRRIYEDNPDRLAAHKKVFAEKTGKNAFFVTIDQLVDQGRVQKQRLQDHLTSRINQGGVEFQRTGVGKFGRDIATFRNTPDPRGIPDAKKDFFAELSNRDNNAGYNTQYNALRRFEDLLSGDKAEHLAGRGSRSFGTAAKDQLVNITHGAGNAVNDILQSASVITGLNSKGVDSFFDFNRKQLKKLKDNFNSPQQLRSERLAQVEAALNTELFEANKRKFMVEGATEGEAKFQAGVNEVGNSIRNLIQNPGRVLDAVFESLPYMLGVGAGGKFILGKVVKQMEKNFLKSVTTQSIKTGVAEAPAVLANRASDIASKFIKSRRGKDQLKKVSARAGISLVGLTEGLSNAATVYDSIRNMTEQEASQSERYQASRFDQNLSHEEATKKLAKEGFIKSFGPITIMAGLAGKISGAAGFEARLFTGLADVRRKAIQAAAGTSLKHRALNVVGRQIARHSKPGLQETVEESIQSGGGQFLSQLAEFNATGKEVGPGVGAATAEGALIGFASGFGISAGSSSVKAVISGIGTGTTALSNRKGKAPEAVEVTLTGILPDNTGPGPGPIPSRPNDADPMVQPGGSLTLALQNVAAAKAAGNYNAKTHVDAGIANIEDVNDPTKINFEKYHETRLHFEQLKRNNPKEAAKVQDKFNNYTEQYKSSLLVAVENIAKQSVEEIAADPRAKANIYEALKAGVVLPTELTGSELGETLGMAKEVADAIDNLKKTAADNAVLESEVLDQPAKTIEQVTREKLGEEINNKGHLGLQAHVDTIVEAINSNDKAAYRTRSKKLGNFVGSQLRKLKRMDKLIKTVEAGGNQATAEKVANGMKYIPVSDVSEGTRGLRNIVANEMRAMHEIQQSLATQFQNWNGADVSIQKVADTILELPVLPAAPEGSATLSETTAEAETGQQSSSESNAATGGSQTLETTSAVATDTDDGGTAQQEAQPDAGQGQPTAVADAKKKTKSKKKTIKKKNTKKVVEASESPQEKTVSTEDSAPSPTSVDTASAPSEGSTETSRVEDNAPSLEDLEAAAQPEVTTEPGFEPVTEDIRVQVAELQRVIEQASNLENAGEITFSNSDLTADMQRLRNGGQTVEQVARTLLTELVQTHGSTVIQAQSSTVSNEDRQQIVEAVTSILARTPVNSITTELLNSRVDFTKGATNDTFGNMFTKGFTSVGNLVKDIIERFRLNKLPVSINKALESKGSTTTQLLAAVPNLMEKLKDRQTRNAFYDALQLTPKQERSFDTVLRFINSFDIQLETLRLKQGDGSNNDLFKNRGKFAAEKLQQYGMQFFYDSEGKLDPNVSTAMALETMNWLATSGADSLFNDERSINSLLGRNQEHEVTPEELTIFDRGITRTQIASQIGNAIFAQLNVRPRSNSNIDSLFHERLAASLGSMAIMVAKEMQHIDITKIDGKIVTDIRKAAGTNNLEDEGQIGVKGLPVFLVSNKPLGQANGDEYVNSAANQALYNSHQQLRNILQNILSVAQYQRLPTFEPAEQGPRKISRGNTLVPKKLREYIGKISQQAWEPDMRMIEKLNRWDRDNFLRLGHQTKTAGQIQNFTHKTNRISAKSKNGQHERSWDSTMDWAREHGNRAFYLNYQVIRSGRINVDGNVINPQSDKIQRFLFRMKDWSIDVKTRVYVSNSKAKGKIIQDDFRIAVALGLGIDPSQFSREDILIELELKLGTQAFQDAIALLQQDSTEKYTTAEMNTLAATFEQGNGTHSLAALQAWADYKTAQDTGATSFASTLPMETDGKTNGFISGLLQTPSRNPEFITQIKDMLRAGGVFFHGDGLKNYPDFHNQRNNVDNYQDVAFRTQDFLGQMTQGILPELRRKLKTADANDAARIDLIQSNPEIVSTIKANIGLKIDRNFAKNPLTVVSYGAGMSTVRKTITNSAVVDFYDKLARSETAEDVATVLNGAVAIVNTISKVNNGFTKTQSEHVNEMPLWTTESVAAEGPLANFRTEHILTAGQMKNYRDGINLIYGHALQAALEEKLAPMQATRDALNQANRLSNGIFVMDFNRRKAELEKRLNKTLSARERGEIINDMIKAGLAPLVKTPLSEGQLDSLETTNYTQEELEGINRGEAHFAKPIQTETRAFGSDGQPVQPEKKKSIGTRLKGPAPNTDVGVSAIVKLIHATDGAVNATVFNIFNILNVHDAQVGRASLANDTARFANEQFFETHSNYNMAQEIFDSLTRLLTVMDVRDSRLNAEEIFQVQLDFMNYMKKFGGVDPLLEDAQAPVEMAKFLAKLGDIVNDNNQAREILFAGISYVNQFAKDGAEFQVAPDALQPAGAGAAINPRRQITITPFTTLEALIDITKEELLGTSARKKTAAINTLRTAIFKPGGDPGAALATWVTENKPTALDVLDAMQQIFKDRVGQGGAEAIRTLTNLMTPLLQPRENQKTVEFKISSDIEASRVAEYNPATRVISMHPTASGNILTKVLHELVHAATFQNLVELQQQKEFEFNQLLAQVKAVVASDGVITKKANEGDQIAGAVRADILLKLAGGETPVAAVSEYLAYMSATFTGKNIDLHFVGQMDQSLIDLAAALQNPDSGKVVLKSSQDSTRAELFAESIKNKLNSETVTQTMNILARHDGPLDPVVQSMFTNLLNNFIQPGMKSIDDLVYKLAVDKKGNRNIGKIVGSTVYLQAAGNKITSPTDMTLQEVGLHEITHALLHKGLEHKDNFKLRQEAERLFFNVKADITWEAFLPAISGVDPAIDERRAKERYDYIFENTDGMNLHEFLAIGLTNPTFATALAQIDDTGVSQPLQDGRITSAMLNILQRILNWLQNTARKTKRGSVHQSLTELADDMVSSNYNQIGVANRLFHERVLDKLNDAAVLAIAEKLAKPLADYAEKKRNNMNQDADKIFVDPEAGRIEKLIAVTKAATNATVAADFSELRKVLESASTGLHKDHAVYQMLTEVMPWADRNLPYIDVLRKSEVMIDTHNQEVFTHTQTELARHFDPKKTKTGAQREAITNVFLKPGLSNLMLGTKGLTLGDIFNLLQDRNLATTLLQQRKADLQAALAGIAGTAKLNTAFDLQTNSLANFMIKGIPTEHMTQTNVHNIMKQRMFSETSQITLNGEKEITELLEHIVTLKALLLVDPNVVSEAMTVMTHEMNRGVVDNGFKALIGMPKAYIDASRNALFDDNPTQMIQGYTADIFDEEMSIEVVEDTPQERQRMKEGGWKFIKPLERSRLDPNLNKMAMYARTLGQGQYSKAAMSLTGTQKRGQGIYDSLMVTQGDGDKQALRSTALEARRNIAMIRTRSQRLALKQLDGVSAANSDVMLMPVLNEEGASIDFRYVMSEADKKSVLKKRDFFDEVFPHMEASISDRNNTKEMNREIVTLLKAEHVKWRNGENKDDYRFLEVSKHSKDPAAREMYRLLPEDTQQAMREAFGGDIFFIRDDVVNLVMGFRKLSVANAKFLGRTAPAIRMAERVWQEVIQWKRFKIAVLNPLVVFGNIVSNAAILLSEGIPAKYIAQHSQTAILGMRKYQREIRARNELTAKIAADIALGNISRKDQAELARLNANIKVNPVAQLVDEGLFTSIVEEFGIDEQSFKRKLATRTLDKVGGMAPDGLIRVAKEAYMVPGSETAQAALAATQYGDFVARFVKFKYDTEVKGFEQNDAINAALQSFIYYNIPQNEWLQFANDNGMLMFTKFFARIQPVILKMFTQNPVRGMAVLGLQAKLMDPFDENIANYGLMKNGTNKFDINPFGTHLDTDLLKPTFLKWIPDWFWNDI